ncbi:MAG TPA: trehalose-phosphatase [Magnetospirillaceae bacterium]
MVPIPTSRDALFLDLDGTLAEIADTPGDVRVAKRVPELLARWTDKLDGALAVVSGRPMAQLLELLAPFEGAMAGIHGLERRFANGKTITAAPLPEMLYARRALQTFADSLSGVALEDKGSALALHYRASPEHGRACRDLAHEFGQGRLVVVPGKMVVELQPKGYDKGVALEAFMNEAPFANRRPFFVGDDRPDEAAFDYVNRVGGISVLAGPSVASTVAQYRLENVSAVLAWLEEGLSAPAEAEAIGGH